MVIRRIPDPTLQQHVKTQFREPAQKSSQLKNILTRIQPREKQPPEKPIPKAPKPVPAPAPEELIEDEELAFMDHIPDVGQPVEWERGFEKLETKRYIPKDIKKPKPPEELYRQSQTNPIRDEIQSPYQPQPSTVISHESLSELVEKESIPLKNIAGVFVGIGLVAFGIWNSGGFYETSSRLSGDLAVFFYVWQVGNLLQIAGGITIYHNILKLRDYVGRKLAAKESD